MSKLPERLKEARKASGKKQREVADALDMKLRGYQSYEMGENEPSIDKLIILADFLDVSIDYLAGRSDTRN